MQRRFDLRAAPDARKTSAFTADLAVEGQMGCGLFLLASKTLRLPLGYPWRQGEEGWEAHERSKELMCSMKALPWMHLGATPHALIERSAGRTDLIVFLGSFGTRHAWGDGCEAAFPGYGVLRTEPRKRAEHLWEDGIALELAWRDARGKEQKFSSIAGSFRLEPGSWCWSAKHPQRAAIRSVHWLVSDAEAGVARARIELGEQELDGTLRLRFRALLKRVTLPPLTFDRAIETLSAPYGFGNFEDALPEPRRTPKGVVFEAPAFGVESWFEVEGAQSVATTLHGARALDPERSKDDTTAYPAAWDVELSVTPGRSRTLEFQLGVRKLHARTPLTPFASAQKDLGAHTEGAHPLRVHTGSQMIDGYVRWALDTARTLIWPNGLITTGSIGYLAKSHIGQDIPSVFPLFLMADHPGFHAAAKQTLRYVLDGPRRENEIGIADHPCDAFDFAFAPFDPQRARYWKAFGAAGLLRWMQCLARYVAQRGDLDAASLQRWITTLRTLLFEHYLPFDPTRTSWTRGEGTQDLLYALASAPRALREFAWLLRTQDDTAGATRCEEAAAQIIERINRPFAEGGYWSIRAVKSKDGARVPAGLLALPQRLDPKDPFFSFDILRYNAVALLNDALTPAHAAQVIDHLLAAHCGWYVEGRGYAKKADGTRGVWYGHNSMIGEALLRASDTHPGAAERALELFEAMGQATCDINGIAIPGEELNGGDHAMAIGCLGVSALIDGALRPALFDPSPRLQTSPTSWAKQRGLRVQNYAFRKCHAELHAKSTKN